MTFVHGKYVDDWTEPPLAKSELLALANSLEGRAEAREVKLLKGHYDQKRSGQQIYLADELLPCYQAAIAEFNPDQVVDLLNEPHTAWSAAGQEYGRVQKLNNRSSRNDILEQRHEEAMRKHQQLGMDVTFFDTYLLANRMIEKGWAARAARIDGKKLVTEWPAVYQSCKCISLEIKNNLIDVLDSRPKYLNFTIVIGLTGGVNKASIANPNSEEYVLLLRALKTNPGFLVEALKGAFPGAFEAYRGKNENYYDSKQYPDRKVTVTMTIPEFNAAEGRAVEIATFRPSEFRGIKSAV